MTPPQDSVSDVERLRAAVLSAMAGRSCREVAPEVGISPATLNRVTRGKMPDLPTYLALCRWLAVPALLLEHDAPSFADLHRLQHDSVPAVKPQLGGSIVEWAAQEITALRTAALSVPINKIGEDAK